MQYLGGKSRISKQISEVINEIPRWKIKNSETVGKYYNEHQFSERERERESNCFVSLFCGSCSVESKVEGFSRKILNDKHEYLIELLNGVKNGYDLPEHISEEEYKYIVGKKYKEYDAIYTTKHSTEAAKS